jgi:hypothetical protein
MWTITMGTLKFAITLVASLVVVASISAISRLIG